jgi:phosphate starvation-inducible PhoH-like protein
MPHTETLHFESARAVEELSAGNVRYLQEAAGSFDLKATIRDGWIRLEGDEENVNRMRDFIEELDDARRRGLAISSTDFNYALRATEREKPVNLGDLSRTRIEASHKKGVVIAKTVGQKHYIESMNKFDLVMGIGPAGTGKTYLAMAKAVSELKEGRVERLILTRPAVEAGEALGFLPGDMQQKIFPYLRPLYDALHDLLDVKEIQNYVDNGVIEIAPLAYMRGRTLSNAFVILDEAQNTTREQMLMFLTRLGNGSKCVVTGDPTQIDLPGRTPSGLIESMHALKQVNLLHFVFFTEEDVVRHPLVHEIINAYKEYRSPGDQPHQER